MKSSFRLMQKTMACGGRLARFIKCKVNSPASVALAVIRLAGFNQYANSMQLKTYSSFSTESTRMTIARRSCAALILLSIARPVTAAQQNLPGVRTNASRTQVLR